LLLDDRKPLKSGKYPVKIRASAKEHGKWVTVYLLTDQEASHKEWEIIQTNQTIRADALKAAKVAIVNKHARALDIVDTSPFISLESLKAIYYGSGSTQSLNVQNLYKAQIDKMVRRGQWGTSKIYFHAAETWRKLYGDGLTLQVIDKDFLEETERKMTIAAATIGMYIRTLKRIFNIAIEQRLISRDFYPFGNRGYRPPTATAEKRALSEKEKKLLVKYRGENEAEARALAVWRFSYYCDGMNPADMARLRRTGLSAQGTFSYMRKKTARTRRDGKLMVVVMRKEVLDIIKRAPGHDYIFGILDGTETAERERKKVIQWLKITNKYLRRIGERLKLSVKLTTYVARHTYASMMMQAGAPVSHIRDAMGHDSIQTTDLYLGSLNLEGKKKWAAKL